MNTTKIVRNITFFIGLLLMNEVSVAQVQESFNPALNFRDFTVNVKEKKINIQWTAGNPTSTNYFEVQKSTDGVNYRTILLVLGTDPQKADCDCYGCFDKFVPRVSRQYYYRLVHVSTDGTLQISEAKQVNEFREVVQNK